MNNLDLLHVLLARSPSFPNTSAPNVLQTSCPPPYPDRLNASAANLRVRHRLSCLPGPSIVVPLRRDHPHVGCRRERLAGTPVEQIAFHRLLAVLLRHASHPRDSRTPSRAHRAFFSHLHLARQRPESNPPAARARAPPHGPARPGLATGAICSSLSPRFEGC